jgi:ADP-heptose:LPS heptosyltransferase
VKILLISLAGIGDTLLATPIIRALRRGWPNAIIDVFVLWKGAADLLQDNPFVNRIYQCDLLHGNRFSSLRLLAALRKNRYDVSINSHPQARTHYRLIAALIGAKKRITHDYECSSFVDRWLMTDGIPQTYEKHSVEQNLDLLVCMGNSSETPLSAPEIFLSDSDKQFADHFISQHLDAKILIGFHVGSGGTKNLVLKRWPLENFEELLRLLLKKEPNTAFLLFGGPQERADHARLVREISTPRLLFPQTQNLKQTAALIKYCRIFVSVDTALMHIAAAVGVPNQIVIEAPTLNKTNYPFRNNFVVVRNPAVSGRNLEYYRYDGHNIRGTREHLTRCMNSITPNAVFRAIEDAIRTIHG